MGPGFKPRLLITPPCTASAPVFASSCNPIGVLFSNTACHAYQSTVAGGLLSLHSANNKAKQYPYSSLIQEGCDKGEWNRVVEREMREEKLCKGSIMTLLN